MYDSRLRLSNQIIEEVRKHFQELVFDTIIARNVKLSEAPSTVFLLSCTTPNHAAR